MVEYLLYQLQHPRQPLLGGLSNVLSTVGASSVASTVTAAVAAADSSTESTADAAAADPSTTDAAAIAATVPASTTIADQHLHGGHGAKGDARYAGRVHELAQRDLLRLYV